MTITCDQVLVVCSVPGAPVLRPVYNEMEEGMGEDATNINTPLSNNYKPQTSYFQLKGCDDGSVKILRARACDSTIKMMSWQSTCESMRLFSGQETSTKISISMKLASFAGLSFPIAML